jgi:hypothetical protein
MAALHLGPDIERRGPCGMSAGPGVPPWQRMQAIADRHLHELLVGRVELDLVNAVAEPVVSPELWRVGVGLETPADGFFSAGEPTQLVQVRESPGRALSLERLAQRPVREEKVVVDERRRLVQDFADARSTS